MIKEYIEDKLRTNKLQYEILDREYKTIRKSEGEINEHIRRLQEDDDIDFVIFSPRSIKYSTKNSIVEYDRKLQDLVQERETVKGKMNRLLEQKMELEKMFQEAEEKQLESKGVKENTIDGKNDIYENVNSKSSEQDEDRKNDLQQQCMDELNNIQNHESIIKCNSEESTSDKPDLIMDEKKIKNWNEKGTIKIKTNGNTGKFFDALAHKKGSTSSRVVRTGLNPNLKLDYNSENSRDRREIKNVLEKKSLVETPVSSFINIMEGKSIDGEEDANNINIDSSENKVYDSVESQEIVSKDDNGGNRFINIIEGSDKKNSVMGNEVHDVVNFGKATDSSLENKFLSSRSKGRKTGDKVIRSDDMQKLISKIELCQKLLLTNKEECNLELKNLKYVLENLV
ncbi:MAG: hypothetical protein E7B11_10705 [Clostridiales bacterium]|nr:hypothetical protein [Clostridiales bacterium]MDU3241023.1 hypothetical protein [Clostridiales bacterium]